MDKHTDRELAELIYRYLLNPWDDVKVEDIEKDIKNNPRAVIDFLVNSVIDYMDRTIMP